MSDQNDYFLTKLFQASGSDLFTIGDVCMAMVVAALLCYMLAHVYRHTHRGVSYSQSFLITLFMMGVSTSVVMMIIGSNIARAFSLVGALSIIRFRTAMKDPRDTGFLFAAMIAGMGCGTGFYMPAIALTVFLSLLILTLHYVDFGVKQRMESVVKATFDEKSGAQDAIEKELGASFANVKLINRLLDFEEGFATNVYVARPKKNVDPREFEARMKGLDGVVRLAVYETDQHADV